MVHSLQNDQRIASFLHLQQINTYALVKSRFRNYLIMLAFWCRNYSVLNLPSIVMTHHSPHHLTHHHFKLIHWLGVKGKIDFNWFLIIIMVGAELMLFKANNVLAFLLGNDGKPSLLADSLKHSRARVDTCNSRIEMYACPNASQEFFFKHWK